MRYFAKEVSESPIYIMGHPYRFDFLATEDPVLIAELDKCIRKQRGGIIAITEERYNAEVSKKNSSALLQNSWKPQPQRHELKAVPLPQDRRAVEVVANPGGRRNGMFARPQVGRDGTVLNGRVEQGPMPDPIQIPSPTQFITPPVANIGKP